MKTKLWVAVFFLLWLGLIFAMFFVVQKPAALAVSRGIAYTISSVLFAVMLILIGVGLGYLILKRSVLDMPEGTRLILAAGLGMGLLGVLGFGLVVVGWHARWQFTLVLIIMAILLVWRGIWRHVYDDAHAYFYSLNSSSKSFGWVIMPAGVAFLFTFLLALAPPFEAFDGLFYHLVVPSLWLRDGVQIVNMPHYWYPALMEGMFVWALCFGLDSTPQLIHFFFGLFSALFLLEWTRELFGVRAGWWSIAILLSMPSLPWLAAWAYTDLGLVFYTLAVLFSLLRWKDSVNTRWLFLAGMFAGFAVGIKYTSFTLPLFALFFLLFHSRKLFTNLAIFSTATLLTGFPWYLRNWFWMGNPFYPFVFGGPFWDSFRATWYSGAGSGIGWDIPQILALPFVVTLGYRDVNFFDGRIGPLYLVLFPFVLIVVWRAWRMREPNAYVMFTLLAFSLTSVAVWTLGVVNTSHLMQSRLLWAGLMPIIPLMSAGVLHLESFDGPNLKLGFIFSVLTIVLISVFLLDFSLLVMYRNPFMVSVGSESRSSYMARIQPSYADAIRLVNQTPTDAFIYSLYEPRTFGMERHVQADAINDNLAHDFYLYATNAQVVTAWKKLGYTHVLVAKSVFYSELTHADVMTQDYFYRLDDLIATLIEVEKTEDYTLFEIPY